MLPQLISSLWKYTQLFELIEGKKDRQFSQHITQLMNDQNALLAESHLK